MFQFRKSLCLYLALWCFFNSCALFVLADEKPITIGYQLIYNPWKVGMVDGSFETATGREIKFRQFDTPAKVLAAMASGQVQIGCLGSTGVTTAFAQGLDVQLFWILEGIASAEALVVRNGSGIATGQDLAGKKMGVPFVSTTHFHTLVALEHFGIDPKSVRILNMNPNAIAAAWQRGNIDAAFVWNPALGRILETGEVLITSGELGALGKPTFDGLVVRREFAQENDAFMLAFVKALAAIDAAYRDNPEAWNAQSTQVAAIVEKVGGKAEDVPAVLASYVFPTLEQQAGCDWLGCGTAGGAAKAILATAQFLKDQKKISRVLPDYAAFVNDAWVKRAAEGQ